MATKKTRLPGLRANLPPAHRSKPTAETKSAPAPRGPTASAPRAADLARPVSNARAAVATAALEKMRGIAQRALSTIETLRSDIGANFYKIGQSLRDLQQPATYRALGYTSFHGLLAKRRVMSRVQATKLIAVANALPERIARAHGVEKAYKIVRYAETRHPRLTAAQVLERNPVLSTDGGLRIRLADIELKDLAAVLRGFTTEERKREKQRTERASRKLGQLLPHAGIDPERVRTIRRRSGAYAVRIELSAEEALDLIALLESRRK